jgi:hypothetical protein
MEVPALQRHLGDVQAIATLLLIRTMTLEAVFLENRLHFFREISAARR